MPSASWTDTVTKARPGEADADPGVRRAMISNRAGRPGMARPGAERGGTSRDHSCRAGYGERSLRSSTVPAALRASTASSSPADPADPAGAALTLATGIAVRTPGVRGIAPAAKAAWSATERRDV